VFFFMVNKDNLFKRSPVLKYQPVLELNDASVCAKT